MKLIELKWKKVERMFSDEPKYAAFTKYNFSGVYLHLIECNNIKRIITVGETHDDTISGRCDTYFGYKNDLDTHKLFNLEIMQEEANEIYYYLGNNEYYRNQDKNGNYYIIGGEDFKKKNVTVDEKTLKKMNLNMAEKLFFTCAELTQIQADLVQLSIEELTQQTEAVLIKYLMKNHNMGCYLDERKQPHPWLGKIEKDYKKPLELKIRNVVDVESKEWLKDLGEYIFDDYDLNI